jgi:hypothetical protein
MADCMEEQRLGKFFPQQLIAAFSKRGIAPFTPALTAQWQYSTRLAAPLTVKLSLLGY